MARTAQQISDTLKSQGLRLKWNLNGAFGGICCWRSDVDPRVAVLVETPKRGLLKKTYHFGDDAVEVDVGASGPVIRDEGRTFATFEALCEGIAAHEAALQDERDWRDADPKEVA